MPGGLAGERTACPVQGDRGLPLLFGAGRLARKVLVQIRWNDNGVRTRPSFIEAHRCCVAAADKHGNTPAGWWPAAAESRLANVAAPPGSVPSGRCLMIASAGSRDTTGWLGTHRDRYGALHLMKSQLRRPSDLPSNRQSALIRPRTRLGSPPIPCWLGARAQIRLFNPARQNMFRPLPMQASGEIPDPPYCSSSC